MRANVIPLPRPRVIHIADWERRAREDLDARRCDDPECGALPPNHTTECAKRPMPDPDAEKCPACEYPAGSLGCRMVHKRRRPLTPDDSGEAA